MDKNNREEGTSTFESCENTDLENDWKPKQGMEFESIEDAWKFWTSYGGKVRFGVRKTYTNMRHKDKRDYLTANPRPETRTNCKARIGLLRIDGKFVVHEFIEEHNHSLHTLETVHMLPSQRNLSQVQADEINLSNDSGLQQRSTFSLMSTQAGGRANFGFTRLDQKNYLRTKRQRAMKYGEVGCVISYFQKQLLANPSFYHTYQMDSEELITNIFWADARMILDYGYFGDVMSFDTTYCTNNSHRPLALFSGFNHFKETVIFGAALLYDETTSCIRQHLTF